ncbi:MAG: guanosine polyphosphate pyrophosphohydrolase [Lachnospiraceae bacterium]|nr:guanosine polyphosphate pyrophosphohydrolase [Lachnospiraceae bacterium]
MISLNDYLYAGDTVLKILRRYSADLGADAEMRMQGCVPDGSQAVDTAFGRAAIDFQHSRFLEGILYQLEHNDFLTFQSNRIREFYKYMASEYPYLAFTFRGRIKSVIRSEEKFNGYITEYIYDYYVKHHTFPPIEGLQRQLNHFRDFIAYRIVLSMPACHLRPGQDREQEEIRYLYEIANALPAFLEKRSFTAEPAIRRGGEAAEDEIENNSIGTAGMPACETPEEAVSGSMPSGLTPQVRPYYRDYVAHPKESGYRSLHIAFFDEAASSYIEVQLRTHEMDNFAEIGTANHSQYEKEQNIIRRRRGAVPEGACPLFDEAYERGMALQCLDLSKIDVNMFTAYNNELMNDGCGLYHGRLILPFEHLSRFQNDLVG